MPEYITENLNTIIDFLIRFLPSFIFICTVIGAGLWGVIRGARKSVILLIHALVSFAICFILFLVFVNSKGFDKLLLNITNSIIGSDTGLQDLLEVNPECESIRECILDFIPRQMSFMDGLELILRDNGAYLSTLVDLVYRIVFGLILYIVYLLLVFIFYIIYFIFYPERRYKKKINKKHRENLSDTPYKKNRLVGGMIGIIRGAASGIIALSFLGTLFFIVSGGTGEERDPDIAFTDDGVNVAYTAYQSISSPHPYPTCHGSQVGPSTCPEKPALTSHKRRILPLSHALAPPVQSSKASSKRSEVARNQTHYSFDVAFLTFC